MALIDVKCANDHIHEVVRLVRDWPATPPCPTCNAPTVQIHLPPRVQWSIDPVIVYRGHDGQFRFPGAPDSPTTRRYDREGFQRIELRSAADVRRFESVMNKHEYSRASRRVERAQQQRELRETHTRSTLRNLMQSMTPFGRALARAAMSRNDDKPRERTKDANFVVEAFSYDRSNREDSRDAAGRRRRD